MPLTTAQLRQRMSSQSWSSHNLRFNEEVAAMPGKPDFLETDLRLTSVEGMLRLVFGERLEGLRIADLGALEGGYSLAAARRGARVVAVEARHGNVDKLRLVKEHFELENLEIVQGDVKDFTRKRFGEFDAVLALGILYHLDAPLPWLRQIAGATRKLLIIDSHVAPADDAALGRIDPSISQLGPLQEVEDAGRRYEGRWFFEYEKGADPEPRLWASYSNNQSFWLTRESLLTAVKRCGFDLVLEQHEYTCERYREFADKLTRFLVSGVRLGEAPAPVTPGTEARRPWWKRAGRPARPSSSE